MSLSPFRTQLLAVAATITLTLTAQAHPGHDWNDASARHLFTSPDHIAALVLCGAGLWFGARFVRAVRPRRILQAAGMATVLIAGVIWGIRL